MASRSVGVPTVRRVATFSADPHPWGLLDPYSPTWVDRGVSDACYWPTQVEGRCV